MAAHPFQPRLGAVALLEKDVQLARTMATVSGALTPIMDIVADLLMRTFRTPGLSPDDDLSSVTQLFERPSRAGI
ncbi:MAG: hypothetical protein ACRELX_16635 [Longimicrobiales bacterium]